MVILLVVFACLIFVFWIYLKNNQMCLIRKSFISKGGINFILQPLQLKHILKTEAGEESYSYRQQRITYISQKFEIEVPIQSAPHSQVSIYCQSCGHDVCVTANSYVRTRRSSFVFFAIPIFFAILGGYFTFSLACWPGILVGATLGISISYPIVSKIWGINSKQFDAEGDEHEVIVPIE